MKSTNTITAVPKPGAQENQAAHHSSTKKIAGRVAGGIGGLAAFLVMAWVCFNRRNKKNTISQPIPQPTRESMYGNQPCRKNIQGCGPELVATTSLGLKLLHKRFLNEASGR